MTEDAPDSSSIGSSKIDSSTIDSSTIDASTIEASGATDDIRYVLNTVPPSVATPLNGKAGNQRAEAGTQQPERPAAAGGLADAVIDNADDQLPDPSESIVHGGKVGQESKRGAY